MTSLPELRVKERLDDLDASEEAAERVWTEIRGNIAELEKRLQEAGREIEIVKTAIVRAGMAKERGASPGVVCKLLEAAFAAVSTVW